ncbi:MAG: hypothetical protein KGI83_06445, partial [Verrucomicrobiota bacterium]|nr:hypothetical protein [Verrucomicrobiota bacterium]
MWIAFILMNFSLCTLIAALLWSLCSWWLTRAPFANLLLRRMLFLAAGVTGVYAFIAHAFFPETAAQLIGWTNSPFQYEVAIAGLTMGVLGLFSWKASRGFCLASVMANCLWFFGDAIGHVIRIYSMHDMQIGNAGSWFWTDVLVPLILIAAWIASR